MKYSIIISPKHKKSNAINHALSFIQSILKNENVEITVFLYSYAVKNAFEFDNNWQQISKNNVTIFACSTIAEKYIQEDLKAVDYIILAGLGQWIESLFDADKNVEFR